MRTEERLYEKVKKGGKPVFFTGMAMDAAWRRSHDQLQPIV
jgi:hypothetical protein